MINFTFKKSQMTQVSLTSVVNYGPRNQEVADRVKSILGMDHDLSSAMSSSVSLSSDKVSNNINQTHIAKPPPPKTKSTNRVTREDVHASIFMQRLNVDILGNEARPTSDSDSDNDEI